jgi:hypothetical protein
MLPIQIIVRKPHQIAIILIHFILLRVKALNLELPPIRYHPSSTFYAFLADLTVESFGLYNQLLVVYHS